MQKKIVKIKSLVDLNVFALEIANNLSADCFLLISGELGSGKTTFVKMIAQKFKIRENVNSPTFNILKSYWIENQNCYLNHFDFFNLKKSDDLLYFEDFKIGNINVIEWPEMNEKFWRNEKKQINIKIFFSSQNQRLIEYYLPEHK